MTYEAKPATREHHVRKLRRKTHKPQDRPPFDCIALLLQGGGALGAYQAGVYQALSEAHLHPDWVAGISIGAINSALIAGNPPEARVEKLREFWELVTAPPLWAEARRFAANGLASWLNDPMPLAPRGELPRRFANHMNAGVALVHGAPGFFTPRVLVPWLHPTGTLEATSYYDTAPLHATLERLVDFDRINAGEMRFSVGAVNVGTGNFVYFDNSTHTIAPEHVMASAALPPGLPEIEIEGEFYWDGGLVSNTPLQWVLDSEPRQDTLAFQVDLWSAGGPAPAHRGRGRDPPERDPVFEPHACGLGSLQVHAEDPQQPCESAAKAARRFEGQSRMRAARQGRASRGLQPCATRVPIQAVRRSFEGLRVLANQHGGALARRVSRRGSHTSASRGARASGKRRRSLHLRSRTRWT